ncbi:MAG: helix-turn-helix domain-containing protein [Candidatus Wallbacteria bacterium]|nr:helix-turn-helix domain-containing protein [Candidatus Wallbacteria bacterium]
MSRKYYKSIVTQDYSPAVSHYLSAFSIELRRLFAQCGLSQAALAKKLHTSPQNVSRWLSGKVLPRGKAMSRLAVFFSVNPDDFIIPTVHSPAHETMIPVYSNCIVRNKLIGSRPVRNIAADEELAGRHPNLFGLLITENSMAGAGILPGDIVICEPNSRLVQGIHAVSIDNGPVMLRVLIPGKGRVAVSCESVLIHAENIPSSEAKKRLRIIGRPVRLIRDFRDPLATQ